MDLVSFTYHHALAPFLSPRVLQMEIETHKVVYNKTWVQSSGAPGYSEGFFPAEMVRVDSQRLVRMLMASVSMQAFSERIIPTLVRGGIQWVVVPNNHISRACANYSFSPSGDNNDPPNRADQINPPQSHWFKMSVSRGCTPNNAGLAPLTRISRVGGTHEVLGLETQFPTRSGLIMQSTWIPSLAKRTRSSSFRRRWPWCANHYNH